MNLITPSSVASNGLTTVGGIYDHFKKEVSIDCKLQDYFYSSNGIVSPTPYIHDDRLWTLIRIRDFALGVLVLGLLAAALTGLVSMTAVIDHGHIIAFSVSGSVAGAGLITFIISSVLLVKRRNQKVEEKEIKDILINIKAGAKKWMDENESLTRASWWNNGHKMMYNKCKHLHDNISTS